MAIGKADYETVMYIGRHRRLQVYHVVHLVNSRWCAAVDGLAQWTVIKEGLLETGGEMLG